VLPRIGNLLREKMDQIERVERQLRRTRRGIGNLESDSLFADCSWDGVAAADVNDDRRIDLIAANGTRGVVNVLGGRGDGTFTGTVGTPDGAWVPPADGFAAGPSPARLIVLDFDSDGIRDVALVDRGTTQITILRGDFMDFIDGPGSAAGTFETRTTYTLDAEATELAAGDLNRDGIPDLAVLHGAARRVSLLLSNAATGEHAVFAGFTVPGTGELRGIAVADITSDGILDLALGGDAIRVYAGRGAIRGD